MKMKANATTYFILAHYSVVDIDITIVASLRTDNFNIFIYAVRLMSSITSGLNNPTFLAITTIPSNKPSYKSNLYKFYD